MVGVSHEAIREAKRLALDPAAWTRSLDRLRAAVDGGRGWLWIIALWLLLIVPAISLRGIHFEEDTVIAIARGATEDGHWLVPHLYGMRFVERPALLSWLIAVLALPFGSIPPMLARVPTVLALLGGGLLIFTLVRRYASTAAALFGAVCFLISPSTLQKLITAEPDLMLTTMLFGIFVLWWETRDGRWAFLPRWLTLGALLAVAGLVKGPQPLAFLFLGVGTFLLLRWQWKELFGLGLSAVMALGVCLAWYLSVYQPGDVATWRAYSRLSGMATAAAYLLDMGRFVVLLALEALPGLALVVPLALGWRKLAPGPHRDLVLALVLYAGCCTLVLLFWPEVRSRYAMPAIPAIAAAAGLVFDDLRGAWPRLVGAAVALALALSAYAVTLNWVVMPLLPDLFQRSKRVGTIVESTMRFAPRPLYIVPYTTNSNYLVYVSKPIRVVWLDALARVDLPASAVLTRFEIETMQRLRPGVRIVRRAELPTAGDPGAEGNAFLVELR